MVRIRNKCSCAIFQSSIGKVANNESLFKINNNNISKLRECMQELLLLLLSTTQLAKSMVKNTSFWKSASKDKSSTSTVKMIQSVTLLEITSSLRKNKAFKNQKRKSKNEHKFICSTMCNAEVLASACDYQKCTESFPSNEVACY